MDKARVTVYLVTAQDSYTDFTTVAVSMEDARAQVLNHVWPVNQELYSFNVNVKITPFVLDVDVLPQPKDSGVYITGFGANKISVIKAVREITGMGLKEAKDMVEAASPTNPVRIESTYFGAGMSYTNRVLLQAGVPAHNIIVKDE